MTTHVVGAGLAGLSAAIALADAGHEVKVWEAAAQAGGRCRSYFDPQLELVIDNGNHLVLSGNRAVMAYLTRLGAADRLAGPDTAAFDFYDVKRDRRWRLNPNEGPLPWWVLARKRRVPGTVALDYLALAGLLAPNRIQRVDEVMGCQGLLWERLLQPILLAILNTEPKASSAALAGAVIRETLAKGGKAYRPRIAEPTLAAAFVEPALAALAAKGVEVQLGKRLRRLDFDTGRATGLEFADRTIELGAGDRVVLATPPWVARELIPDLTAPDEFRAIVNAHYRIAPPPGAKAMVGLIGGTAEWVFAFPDRLSVTVSGADHLVDRDREDLARVLWQDVAATHRMSEDLPPWQIVKEKRATFAATPEQDAKRPEAKTRWSNLVLAGDWTQTGLPATIEGALRSGATAAALAGRG
jgi:squalene-associated FAD-dependent desaturase